MDQIYNEVIRYTKPYNLRLAGCAFSRTIRSCPISVIFQLNRHVPIAHIISSLVIPFEPVIAPNTCNIISLSVPVLTPRVVELFGDTTKFDQVKNLKKGAEIIVATPVGLRANNAELFLTVPRYVFCLFEAEQRKLCTILSILWYDYICMIHHSFQHGCYLFWIINIRLD